MSENNFKSLLDSNELLKIFSNGVANAIEENKKFGIPSVFSIEGTMIFQMPDGTIKTENEVVDK